MDSVELVKKICKERKIPISKLERDCDFSNGYIRKLKEGKFPSDRLQKIADYLDVSVEYLLTGSEGKILGQQKYYTDDRTAEIAQKIFDNKELRLLFDEAVDASPEDLQTAHDILLALKRKERGTID